MCAGIPRIVLNFILKCLCRFLQFPGHIVIVGGSDSQPFPLTGMFAQFKCLGEILAGPSDSPGYSSRRLRPEAHGEVRIKLMAR